MTNYPAMQLLEPTAYHFPEVEHVGGTKYTRQIIVIDGEEDDDKHDRDIPHVFIRSRDTVQVDAILKQLLTILDENLGTVYRRVSRRLYGNAKSWQQNKQQEMVTSGMIYVVYIDPQGQAAFYLSFMLTDEEELEWEPELTSEPRSQPDPQLGGTNAKLNLEKNAAKVVYLYEIQLSARLQGQGLGTVYVGQSLKHVAHDLKAADPSVRGVELTVFSDNGPALRLYRRLGLQLADWSPRDEIMHVRRSTRRATDHNAKVIRKPAYYVFFWAL